MGTGNAAGASYEHGCVARIGTKRQGAGIEARAKGQRDVFGRVARNLGVHQDDTGAIIGDKSQGILCADDTSPVDERERRASQDPTPLPVLIA